MKESVSIFTLWFNEGTVSHKRVFKLGSHKTIFDDNWRQFAATTKRSFSSQNKGCNKAYYATDLTDNGTDFDQEISLWMKYWASEQKSCK